MEIQPNSSRVANPATTTDTAVRRTSTREIGGEESLSRTTDLQSKLNELPEIRPGKVEQAKALITDDVYPPVYLLERLASLFSTNIKE